MTVPTEQQIGELLEAARPEFRAFIALCAFAGLRSGEAAGVQVGDIDFLRRELTVQRQVQPSAEDRTRTAASSLMRSALGSADSLRTEGVN